MFRGSIDGEKAIGDPQEQKVNQIPRTMIIDEFLIMIFLIKKKVDGADAKNKGVKENIRPLTASPGKEAKTQALTKSHNLASSEKYLSSDNKAPTMF